MVQLNLFLSNFMLITATMVLNSDTCEAAEIICPYNISQCSREAEKWGVNGSCTHFLLDEYSLKNCSTANICTDFPCYYGGTCHEGQTTYSCECGPLFTGNKCQTNDFGFELFELESRSEGTVRDYIVVFRNESIDFFSKTILLTGSENTGGQYIGSFRLEHTWTVQQLTAIGVPNPVVSLVCTFSGVFSTAYNFSLILNVDFGPRNSDRVKIFSANPGVCLRTINIQNTYPLSMNPFIVYSIVNTGGMEFTANWNSSVCNETNLYQVEWIIYKSNKSADILCLLDADYSLFTSEIITGNDYDDISSYVFTGVMLPPQNYRICLLLRGSRHGSEFQNITCGYLKIIARDLEAIIKPVGIDIYWLKTLPLKLDASDSIDHNTGDNVGLSYQWKCETLLSDECFFSHIIYGEDIYRPGLHFSAINIPVLNYVPDDVYVISVIVSKEGMASNAIKVKIHSQKPTTEPYYYISCSSLCTQRKINKGIPTFKISCYQAYQIEVECSDIKVNYWIFGAKNRVMTTEALFFNNQYFGINYGLLLGEVYFMAISGTDSNNITRSVNKLIQVNTVPRPGICSTSPATGFGQLTKFTINCFNFVDEDQPLEYQISVEGHIIVGSKINDGVTFEVYLPATNVPITYFMPLHVTDSEAGILKYHVSAKLLPIEFEEDDHSTVALQILKRIESFKNSSQSESEQRTTKTKLVTVLNTGSKNDTNGTIAKIREMLIEEFSLSSATTPGNLSEMNKNIDFLNLLVEKPEEITQLAEDMARSALVHLSENLVDMGKTSVNSTKDIAWKLLHGTSKLMSGFINRGQEYLSVNNITESSETAPDVIERERNNTSEFIKILDAIGKAMFDVVQPNEPPIIIQASKLSLTVGRFSTALENFTQSFCSSCGFTIPDILAKDNNTSPQDIPAGFQIGEYQDNPYLWSPTAKSIDIPVRSIALKNSNGTDLTYNNLAVPFDLEIFTYRTPSFGDTDYEITLSVAYNLFTYTIVNSDTNLIVVPFTPNKTIMAIIKPLNTSLTIHVLPFYDKRTVTLQKIMEDGFTVPIIESNLQTHKHYTQDPHMVIIPEIADMEADELYIGIGVTLGQILNEDIVSSSGSSGNLSVQVHVEIFRSHCAFWDSRIEEWSQEGCQLTNYSTIEVLHCQCNHLTAFSGGMLVIPNILNPILDIKLFLTFFDNPIVVFTVVTVWLLYLFLLYWARAEDKKDYRNRGVTVLEDNDSNNHYIYLVGILTGWWRGAGTSADVFIYLRSKNNQSSRHALVDSERLQFISGSEDWFLLTTPARIGKIKSVIIWHNNSGKSPSWYLKEVIIKDVQTEESWHCIYNNWLCVDRGSKELRAEIPAIVEGNMQNQQLYQFFLKSSQDFRDGHLWISIFSKPIRSNFTRTQRLTCALSLLITCMLTNLMFLGVPDTVNPQEQISQSTFQLNLTDIIVGIETALILFPINFTLMQLFIRISPKPHQSEDPRLADYYKTRKKEEKEKKQSARFTVPWWFVYISWTIAILSSMISSYFVMLYGLKYGYATSFSWLITFFTSFSQSALITQPCKVLLLAFIVTLIFRRPASYQPAIPDEELEDNEEYLQKRIIEKQIMWQEGRKEQQRYYIPPISKNSIKNIQQRLKVESIMKESWREIFMYIMFVVIVLLTVHGHSHVKSRYLFSNVNKNMFIDAKYTKTLPFNKVTTFDKFWNYTETLLNNFRQNDDSSTTDGTSYLLGKARLRQVRQQKNKCDSAYFNQFGLNNLYCTGSYWMGNDDTGFYNKSWKKEIDQPPSPDDTTEWFFQSSWQLQTLPYVGHHAYYPGSGFVLEMSLEKLEASLKFAEMKNTDWIDDRTRAVFIEFTLYNPNINLFSVMILLAEFTNYDGVFSSYQIFTTNLYHYANDFEVFIAVCECIFIIFILSFTYFEIDKFSMEYKSYFKGVWSYVEVSILLLSYSAIGIFACRILTVNKVLQEYKDSNGEKFISFYTAISWDYILQYILACLVTLVVVKLFKLLNFSKNIPFLSGTLQEGKAMICGVTLLLVVSIMAFGHFSYLVFGSQLKGYSNILKTINTLFNFILGISDYFGLVSVNSILGSLFFFTFSLLFQYILVTMYFAVIITAFTTFKNKQRLRVDDELDMIRYLYTKIRLMTDL